MTGLPEPIPTHDCLTGERRVGDAPDCPHCRLRLLEAFRAPARPHLVPEGHGRAVSLSGPVCPFCRLPRDDMNDHVRNVHPDAWCAWSGHDHGVPHVTGHGIVDDPAAPGGRWFAVCTCGWNTEGHYFPDDMSLRAQATAQQTALKHGHEENP